MATKNESRKYYLYLIKSAVFLLILYFIYRKVEEHPEDFQSLQHFLQDRLSVGMLVLLALLIPVNWGLEIVKWRYLVRTKYPISWKASTEGVLSGLAMGFITPHGIGDYFGRLTSIDLKGKSSFIGLIMASRFAQLSVTVCFGMLGVTVILSSAEIAMLLGLFSGVGVAVVVLLKYISSKKRKRYLDFIGRYFEILRSLTIRSYAVIFVLSVFRYMTFAFQMTLAIRVFADQDWWLSFAGTTWILLAKSVIPSFNFLSDLGIREFSGIYFFDNFQVSPVPVIAATLLIWCLNIVLPTLAGAFLMLKIRFK
ncbi:lysylphosphatidylglycerol synthase domain-containing protein [Fulvivirga sedimenti]|uniref:Flippase-like domain-containing protein n=1 Tax=Fulvivirga sedimenti TaxID=2879465 RepID=A0A9X1HTA1_9BACT|nr:lysylphosphatidylglycerol synthase domain-containing protein [Fulvivirga sedimenti]MCA6075221.1 flippase-like domain-containing protein [Fulvivirga sedimenti]MCA6076398.1 flippase-like domain-containing protein [Fulvivirga sedimenti]MCA6077526.1 flippase-like domain-containing protein [Fulvivirga sedimenti]